MTRRSPSGRPRVLLLSLSVRAWILEYAQIRLLLTVRVCVFCFSSYKSRCQQLLCATDKVDVSDLIRTEKLESSGTYHGSHCNVGPMAVDEGREFYKNTFATCMSEVECRWSMAGICFSVRA